MSTFTMRVGTGNGPVAATVRPALSSTITYSSAPPGQVEADWRRMRPSGGSRMVERASASTGALRRVLIVDDHPVVRAGLAALLTPQQGLRVVAEAADGAEGVALHRFHLPDVTLMNLRMPRMDGIAAIRAIRSDQPNARIIALTSRDGDADIHRALDAGACGYLTKSTPAQDIVSAVCAAAGGRRVIPPEVAERLAEFTPRLDLTAREVEVLRLVAKGLRNRDIARVISRTEDTIKAHLKHLMAKLGTSDRTEAVTIALQRGIIHLFE